LNVNRLVSVVLVPNTKTFQTMDTHLHLVKSVGAAQDIRFVNLIIQMEQRFWTLLFYN